MQQLTMKVWHLSRTLAVAHGMASNTEHKEPFTGATCQHRPADTLAAMQLWQARCYKPVAVLHFASARPSAVEDALEFAFEATNHIDTAWDSKVQPLGKLLDDNRVVQALQNGGNRSTSVGDIVEVLHGAVTKRFICMPTGFAELTGE